MEKNFIAQIILTLILIGKISGRHHFPNLELDTLKCPLGCVCQYAHFMDLPISRWINHMQSKQPGKAAAETAADLINENEAVFEKDESFLFNPLMKQATCILQEDSDPIDLINSLPHDLQALVMLYTGEGRNKTVSTSVLQTLNQLTTLEIRGTPDLSFKLIIDEPLSFLQHANFESILLLGSDNLKRPKNPTHPHDSFDYMPNSEKIAYNISLETEAEAAAVGSVEENPYFENENIEILPYEVYLMELKKSRMATFYGWENLEVLRIHLCKLDELHWEMFDGLNSLQHLSLERNEIKVIPAFALYGALHIKTLSLAHNMITDLHYRSLAGLLELELLDLKNNRLTKLSELNFPPFPKLEYIDFENNPIRYIFPATFAVMNNTRKMIFGSRDMALELWGNAPFNELKELRELKLGNVSIGILEHSIFQGLTMLMELHIKGNIRSIEFDAFAGMVELREIDLSDCGIKEISMDSFMGCKKLEIIDLSNNNLSYIPPGLFDDQTVLAEVYLQKNSLRYLPSTFFNNPAMKLVRLTDNPWKCNCDMLAWKPKVTNQERGPRMERCVKEFHSGKTVSCYQVDNYKFDNKLSPRCANENGRSVYYALRKALHCSTHRLNNLKHSEQRMHKFRHLEERRDRHKDKIQLKKEFYKNHGKQVPNRLTWHEKKIDKIQRTIAQRNSLDFLTRDAPKKDVVEDDIKRSGRVFETNENTETSNDI